MSQKRSFAGSSVILCLALFAAGSLFADGPDPDGWVVAVKGRWTRAGKDVRLYDAVFVNDKLQGTSGTIEVALKDGQSPHLYPCGNQPCACQRLPCAFAVPGFRPVPDSLLARLGRAFGELASHRDTMPVSAISRGSEHLRQSVIAINGDRLDLKDAVKPIGVGTYTVFLRMIETFRATMQGRVKGRLDWDPPASTSASFPALAPGIYELTIVSSEGDSLGSVPVLVAGPADHAAMRQSFEAAVQSLPQDLDPVTLDAFLNALLFDIGRGAQ